MSRNAQYSNDTLTPKQVEVYLAIKGFIDKYHYSPSIRELCKMCGLNSTATMFVHLKKMRKKGYIDYIERKMRTITIVKEIDYDII